MPPYARLTKALPSADALLGDEDEHKAFQLRDENVRAGSGQELPTLLESTGNNWSEFS